MFKIVLFFVVDWHIFGDWKYNVAEQDFDTDNAAHQWIAENAHHFSRNNYNVRVVERRIEC